jgi:indolepyruvate ferredoxin oxidoreductase
VKFLAGYQDAAYAQRYADLVARVRAAESAALAATAALVATPAFAETPALAASLSGALAGAVARNYFKLLAHKDEYEVARLYTDGRFEMAVQGAFEGTFTLQYHFAPPFLAKVDPVSGEPQKRHFGAWIRPALSVLARLRFLRGTAWDPFSYSDERRLDLALIDEYEASVGALLARLDAANHALVVEIASLPEQVRGYGPVRARSARDMRARREERMEQLARQAGKAAMSA